MWMSPHTILVQVCAAVQSVKDLCEVEYRLGGVMINKYTFSQSLHWCHSSETAEPIAVKYDNNDSTNGESGESVWMRQNIAARGRRLVNM